MTKTRINKLVAVVLAAVVTLAFFAYMPRNIAHAESQADAIVSIALAEEGYGNSSVYNGDNKYGAYFGNNNVAWCAYFVSWCARQAGIPESIIKTNAWAGSMSSSKRTGNFGGQYYPKGSITPQKGDIVYYGWGNSTSEHVEIVVSVNESSKTFTSIGGNTKGNTKTVGVRRHSNYSFTSSQVVGFERPNYSGSSVSNPSDIVLTVIPGTNLASTKFSWNEINGITRYGVRVYEADNWDNQYYAAWDHTGFDDSFQLPVGNYMAQAMYQIPDSDFVFGGMIYFNVIDSKLITPIVSTAKDSYAVGETINVSWTASPSDSLLSHYWLVVKNPEEKEIIGETMGKNTSYSFNVDKPGEYIIKTYATPMDSKEGEGSLTDTKTINVYLQGDINADGKFSVADAVLLQKWLLAVPDTKLADWKAADLCEDDRLDVFDLCLMKRMLVENN